MKKLENNRKTKTFTYKGLGVPVKLVNASMKKAMGVWFIAINMNKLMQIVLDAIIHKPTALTKDELRYIRTYLEMTMTNFGNAFGESHGAVLKWEGRQNRISPPLELCIRLYVLNHLGANDEEFRAFYRKFNLHRLSKSLEREKYILVVDATTDDMRRPAFSEMT